METTGKALVAHWQWAAKKGLMNANTAAGLGSACAQVLGALEGGDALDVTKLDVEEVLGRFQNLRGKKYRPKVLDTYKKRFRYALASYLDYLKDPGGWKPRSAPPRAAPLHAETGDASRPAVETTVQPLPATGLVEYPFPVREGLIARLVLPRDLKAAELKRLHAFMSALLVDDEDRRI